MSNYGKDILHDFVRRTRVNLKMEGLYADTTEDELPFFEVTALLNSLFGLIIVPQQIMKRRDQKIEDNFIDSDLFRKIKENIIIETDGTLNNICRHLRNSLAHYRIDLLNENKEKEEGNIEYIRFYDKENKNSINNFDLVLSIDDIREFLDQFSKKIIELQNKI